MESAEHLRIPDPLTLHFKDGDRPASSTRLRTNNPDWTTDLLTYGQIVALGGDFFGTSNQTPLSDIPENTRGTSLTSAYGTLTGGDPAERRRILNILAKEISTLDSVTPPAEASHAYAVLGDELSLQWNVATGGGRTRLSADSLRAIALLVPAIYILDTLDLPIPQGRYLLLAQRNLDHFGQDAVKAYVAGHDAAMKYVAAHGSVDPRVLEIAYGVNAFADHFLTDLFSAGHLRTPRRGLYNVVGANVGFIPLPTIPGVPLGTWISGILSRYMHDEDCLHGLAVHNAKGETWEAFGDKRLFDSESKANLSMVRRAVQVSIDEVYQAFKTRTVTAVADMGALKLIPDLKRVTDVTSRENHSPLFLQSGSEVHCRTDLDDIKDYNWTNTWAGITTLTELWSPAIRHGQAALFPVN